MRYIIEGEEVRCVIDGQTIRGGDEVLLDGDENLISGLPWEEAGYTVQPFLRPEENKAIHDGFVEIVRSMMAKAGVDPGPAFQLDQYHNYVNQEQHYNVVGQIQAGLRAELFPVPLRRLEERLSEICRRELIIYRKESGERSIWIRVIRPKRPDNNPLHRDVWLDRLRHRVNIYFPLAGSNKRSSLCVIPGSHRWKESDLVRTGEGATVNGVAFSVPAVVSAAYGLEAVRPDPNPDEVLVFSPYLVHGGAMNLNEDITRFSLEVRFHKPGQVFPGMQ